MIEQIYKNMDREDKNNATGVDFEGMKCEIDDNLQRFVDMICFGNADLEDLAIIDATMTTVHDIVSEGTHLIRERHE